MIHDNFKRVFGLAGIVFLMMLSFQSGAQGRYVIEAGQSIADVIPHNELYQYPEFKNGQVHHKNGALSEALLNYSYVVSEMHFLNGSDTLAIANPNTIDYISIGADTFIYYEDNCLYHISGNSTIDLYEEIYLNLSDIKQEGAYGTSSSTTSADNITSINVGSASGSTRIHNLKVNQERVYTKRIEYYIKGKDGEILPARRRSFLNLYPEARSEIRNFVRDESIRFDEKEDLEKLINELENF